MNWGPPRGSLHENRAGGRLYAMENGFKPLVYVEKLEGACGETVVPPRRPQTTTPIFTRKLVPIGCASLKPIVSQLRLSTLHGMPSTVGFLGYWVSINY